MGQISEIRNPWRQILLSSPAKFREVIFHVETGNVSGGRRAVVHEYPKRNMPYTEDMGQQAMRWAFSGYLIYRPSNPMYQYHIQRGRLIDALNDNDAGTLVHPVFAPAGVQAVCVGYSMVETRERGGFTQFEMQFVNAGQPGNFIPKVDTVGKLAEAAANANVAAVGNLNEGTPQGATTGTVTIGPIQIGPVP